MTEEAKVRRIAQLERELRAFEAERTRCESGPSKRYADDRCNSLLADIERLKMGGKA
jgi:hypothetical protein